ncbi:MAG: helix-turn-helix domain-containing protein [Nocardioidaceae bacterium]
MNADGRGGVGERIAFHRKKLGLSQVEFAAKVDRSESWVSQVERGVRPVDRLSVLQTVANVLGVSTAELRGTRDETPVEEPAERPEAYEELRLALTGHPALSHLFGTDTSGNPPDTEQLSARHEGIWAMLHDSRYSELAPALAELIPALEHASRAGDTEADQVRARRLLSDTYQVTAAMLARTSENDAAWVAADRAAFVAERLDEPLVVAAGLFRMAHVFLSLRQLRQAQWVAETASRALEPPAGDDVDVRVLSLYGAFQLVLSVVAAQENERTQARERLAKAQHVAERIGEDRNDFGTEFGPTNVAVHAVSIAVDLGDAGTALERAGQVDITGLSPERQARFLVDIARAQAMRRQIGDALRSLERAEQIAPEQARDLKTAREVARDLVQLAGARTQPELRDLAERLDALT